MGSKAEKGAFRGKVYMQMTAWLRAVFVVDLLLDMQYRT
jgi:hypothetical protein